MGRLLVGNLDCEAAWATAASPARKARALSPAARARAVTAGSLLAALGDPGDRLWLPGPADDRARARAAAWDVALVSGALDRLGTPAAVLAWGETAATAAARGPADATPAIARDAPWWRRLWSIAPPAPAIAARVADRRFGHALAERLGVALPGARVVATVAELEDHLAAGGAAAGDGAWVLKPPFAAAGRDRLRHAGPLDRASQVRAARLLERAGALVFEPWLDRVEDLGQGGLVEAGGVALLPPHRSEVDHHGVFRAAVIDDQDPPPTDDRAALARCAAAAGEALAVAGYRGPFAIDAFRYRAADGAVHLHPLCELNARLTFGLLARVHAERSGARGRFVLEP